MQDLYCMSQSGCVEMLHIFKKNVWTLIFIEPKSNYISGNYGLPEHVEQEVELLVT